MATLPELEQAFVKADTAGNAEDAAAFASEIKRLRGDSSSTAPRRAVDIMGADSKLDRDRALLKSEEGRKVLANRGDRGNIGLLMDIGAEGGGATAGQMIGALPVLSGPTFGASIPIGGALGGMGGNIIAQNRRILSGEQDKFKLGQLLSTGLVSAIPGGGVENAGAKALAQEAAKQGAAGLTGKTIESLIDEGALPSTGGVLASILIPAAGGALAQKVGSKGIDALNPTKRATLEAGKEAGLVVTPSSVNDSGINKRLESIAGKAAVGQGASKNNQEVVTALAKQAIGVPQNVDITETVLNDIRKEASAPYSEIEAMASKAKSELADVKNKATGMSAHETAAMEAVPDTAEKIRTLSIQAGADIDELRKVRDIAKKNYLHYEKTGTPSALDTAEMAQETAKQLEDKIEKAAAEFGTPELVDRLRAARTRIAKTHDVENALNVGDADVSARILARALNRGRPLSGELENIAKFTEAFPSVMREGASIPTPGVSKVEAGTAALLAALGAGATHSPSGALLGALPLLSGPTRALVLSKPYQKIMTAAPFAMPDTATAIRTTTQAAGQEVSTPPKEEDKKPAPDKPKKSAMNEGDPPSIPSLPTLSPSEAKKAPTGTQFVGTNGQIYEKLEGGTIARLKIERVFA